MKNLVIIILNGEKLNAFPPGSETRQGYPFLPPLTNIKLDILSNCNNRSERNEDHIDWNKKKELINKFSKIAR